MPLPLHSDDTFLVLSKAKGWWIVQRDTSGSGTTAPDSALAGWVPAGCLLELARPPATSGGAFGGAGAAKGKLRLGDVVSTSYPGVALMSYAKAGGDEMDLSKDDVMWVFKRYSHWSYVRAPFPSSLLARAYRHTKLTCCLPPLAPAGHQGEHERARLGPVLVHRLAAPVRCCARWRRDDRRRGCAADAQDRRLAQRQGRPAPAGGCSA